MRIAVGALGERMAPRRFTVTLVGAHFIGPPCVPWALLLS